MFLSGPLHKVQVRFVSVATIHKAKRPGPGERLQGLFVPAKNLIYVDKSLPAAEKLHVLTHEWAHAMEYQVSGLDEEQRCDVLGLFLAKVSGAVNVQDILEE